ncbi:solute carrier family 25 member 48 isoform X2 [Tupaia chinensis]|nr:solute carrier family 25 member 48 isoform X2 [Tupaia chinensis]
MVYRRESVFGFFKGMSFPLASIAVYNSVVFGVFSNTQRFLSQHRCREPEASPPRTLSDLLLASMVAGVVSVGLGGPVDLIKIRLQMQTQPFQEANLGLKPRVTALGEQPAYQGPVHCIATIVKNEGLAGLYRGASAMLLRDVPGYCLYFIPYIFLSEWITPEACTAPSPCAVWLAGGMAGVFQRHHSERGAGLPHERSHVPGVRAVAASHPRGPGGDEPLSARLMLRTAPSPAVVHLLKRKVTPRPSGLCTRWASADCADLQALPPQFSTLLLTPARATTLLFWEEATGHWHTDGPLLQLKISPWYQAGPNGPRSRTIINTPGTHQEQEQELALHSK